MLVTFCNSIRFVPLVDATEAIKKSWTACLCVSLLRELAAGRELSVSVRPTHGPTRNEISVPTDTSVVSSAAIDTLVFGSVRNPENRIEFTLPQHYLVALNGIAIHVVQLPNPGQS
jgi:hypothetical protein